MSNSGAPDTERERGKASRDGFGDADRAKAPQQSGQEPNLAPPAEEVKNPPTHPTRDDGLGQANGGTPRGDRPVPPGEPNRESDRTDLQ